MKILNLKKEVGKQVAPLKDLIPIGAPPLPSISGRTVGKAPFKTVHMDVYVFAPRL